MKKMYWGQFLALTFCLFLGSCDLHQQNDLEPAIAKNDEKIDLKEGLLRFSSIEVFQASIKGLKTDEDINSWERRFNGFVSLKNHYDELVKNDVGEVIKTGMIAKYQYAYKIEKDVKGIDDYVQAVKDNALASILNKDGLVQIGDNIYRVNDEHILKANIRYKADLLQGINANNVQVQNVTNLPVNEKHLVKARLSGEVDGYDDVYYTPWSGASQRRFSINWWAKQYCWLGYISMGMDVSHKRNNWWGWGAIDASNWQGQSNGTFVYSVQETYSLYRTVNASSSSYEQLRIEVPSSTCSGDGNRSLNFTELYINVTGNDGVRRYFSHAFSTTI